MTPVFAYPHVTDLARDNGVVAFAPAGTDQRGFPRVLGRQLDRPQIDLPPEHPLVVTPVIPPAGDTVLQLVDAASGWIVRSFVPFPTFGGIVHAAVADVNYDGFADVVVGAGAGGGPHVKVFDGATGAEVFSFYAYDLNFTGGVNVAAGYGQFVTGAGAGGGPHVKVFDGQYGRELVSFYAYDESFRGGVSVAAWNVNGDGRAEVVTGAGPGGGPNVKLLGVLPLIELNS